jgi:hypothetical protein
MKKQFYLFVLLFFPCYIQAQNVGIGTTTPHPNAILDISGINKGMLIPRGDAATRTALIGNTAKGLLMYDTVTANIWVHNGINGWEFLSIGRNYWVQNGALGTEIKNTNTGGFWSSNATTVVINPGAINPPVSGGGTRMFWMPLKSAFRAGTVFNTEWDAANIGTYSFASGNGSMASGQVSTSLGNFTSATGFASFAIGSATTASAHGSSSMGQLTTASGYFSLATGLGTTARAFNSTGIGRYNDSIISSSQLFWVPTDPAFYIGNGTSDEARHNAMVVYKNGNMVLKNPTTVTTDPVGFTVPISGAGTRMMWLPEKSAFRVGTVYDLNWNADSIGTWSFASGCDSKAKGTFSSAMGYGTNAIGDNSTTFGNGTKAIGAGSTAMGKITSASGYVSTAMGVLTSASGVVSTAMGDFTTASGVVSTAMGENTIASGNFSTSMGLRTVAKAHSSLALGQWNDSIAASNDTSWINTDPLLILGNGTSDLARHNAMVVYKNGNMVLKNPTTVTTDPVGFTVPISGAGTRMMWLPEKSAFRVGTVGSSHWDASGIGLFSFASGRSTNASGYNSTAMGNTTSAIGAYSTSMGEYTAASGSNSTAMGANTNASGSWSTAMGLITTASGNASTALGDHTVANAYASVVIGQYDSTFTSSNSITWVATDPLLILGNGTNITRRNALIVLKNGNTGIGTSTPGTNKLDVNGNTQTDSLQVGSGTKFSKMQAGTFLAGGGAAQLKVVTIFFPSAFSTIPKITVTPRNEAGTNNNDVYAVTVRSITATGVVINILRVDVAAGWGQNLQLDWQAWTQ